MKKWTITFLVFSCFAISTWATIQYSKTSSNSVNPLELPSEH